MLRKGVKSLLALLLVCTGCAPSGPPFKADRWVVYYNNQLPPKAFRHYDVVVFDRLYHPDLKPLKGKVTLLAYVSAGEIHSYEKENIAKLRKAGALFKKNKQWGGQVVDLTSATWRGMVLNQVQDALNQGFDGVMLDTIESPLYAASAISPTMGQANHEAAVELIASIRQAHPDIKLMLNRGLSILPEVSQQLDFILAESILSETNVSTGQSELFSPNTYRQVADELQDAARESPQLKIYTLDYWNKDDVNGIRRLYALQRDNGFSPYVTTPDLQTLSPEPHSRQHRLTTKPIAVGREDHDA